ncbi:NmrA family NAD(P)-binding protein [Pseudomonas sp. XK-1]|uniref:NmrA family NAD(P)-binding protein n=1 Tax=Pseudomonas sp. XK-1 TaxID=3136019 RepID=UPI0031198503
MSNVLCKPVPQSVAIFGASGHIGGPMARYLQFHAPQVRLRLIGSNADKVEILRENFPGVEVVQANYFDQASLDAAMVGMAGVMVLTTTGLREEPAMNNLVAAVRKAGCLTHMIRVVGVQPDSNPRRIPQALRDYGLGLEIQHPIARQILDEAELPVTYLNVGASYMDNFLRMVPSIQNDLLPWPDRLVPYVDPREVGEAAARLMLSDDARHIGQFYTLNNGDTPLRTSEVAQLMTKVFLRRIHHDGSREALDEYFKPLVEAGLLPPQVPEYLWNFFQYEEANAPVWVPNQFLERVLGRKPTTLRAWLQEHRQRFDVDEPLPALVDAPSGGQGMDKKDREDSLIDGVWQCAVSTPVGKEPYELHISTGPEGTLRGEMRHLKNGSVMPLLNGRFSGNQLAWSLQLLKPFKATLKVEVSVEGHALSGHARTGLFGKAAIRGMKNPSIA